MFSGRNDDFFDELIDILIEGDLSAMEAFDAVDVLKKEYRIRRSWEKQVPLVVKDFEKVKSLFSEIKGFDVIPLKRLKKGKHYQLMIKSDLSENKAHLTGLPWEFETDWYTINFIY